MAGNRALVLAAGAIVLAVAPVGADAPTPQRVPLCAGDCAAIAAPTVSRPVPRVAAPRPRFPTTRAVRDARRWVRGRRGASFALIDTRGRLRGFEPHRRYVSASVVKAMLLVARLRQIGNRVPSESDHGVLAPMIRVSDNDAADVAYSWVGDAGLLALARRARMRDLTTGGHWGATYFSAADQARFFRRVDRLVPKRSRAYARRLLSSIVGYQRWGFSRVARRHGWRAYFKGGWRQTELGSLVHEAALFEHRGRRFSLAVLTDGNPSHDYGTATLRGVAKRLFR